MASVTASASSGPLRLNKRRLSDHPFGSEKVLGRETIVKIDAMPGLNCKT